MQAIERGRIAITEQIGERAGSWELAPADGKRRMFMIGNDAVALGALAAGVRFMAAYPITPASEIMEYMIKSCRLLAVQLSKQRMKSQQQQWRLVQTMAVFVPLQHQLVRVCHL